MRTHGVYSINELRFIIRPLLRSYGMDSACLFGSHARGEADGSSDIDIILVGGEHFVPLDVFGFAEDLRRLTGKSVDAYEIRELDEGPFRDRALSDAVAI